MRNNDSTREREAKFEGSGRARGGGGIQRRIGGGGGEGAGAVKVDTCEVTSVGNARDERAKSNRWEFVTQTTRSLMVGFRWELNHSMQNGEEKKEKPKNEERNWQ